MKRIMTMTTLLAGCLAASASGTLEEGQGKPIIQAFTNFHAGWKDARNDRGFELTRGYFGYEYALGKSMTITGILDVGKSKQIDDYHRIAYIKNIMLQWENKNLGLNVGLIPTTQFRFQEKFWNYRYILKSFQDRYKFGESADLGISATYRLTPWLKADAMIANGEGYKKVQLNDGLMYGAGITLEPVKRLFLRVYGGFNQSVGENKEDRYNLSTFIGYQHPAFSIGGEYNWMKINGGGNDREPQGFSFYAQAKLNKFTQIFSRYDQLFADEQQTSGKNEKSLAVGTQFKIGKYLKLAPTFTYTRQDMNHLRNQYQAGIYCYFGL